MVGSGLCVSTGGRQCVAVLIVMGWVVKTLIIATMNLFSELYANFVTVLLML